MTNLITAILILGDPGAPLIYRATPQWFILQKNKLRDAVKAMRDCLYPDKGKERLLSMIEEDQTGVFLDKEFGSSITYIH